MNSEKNKRISSQNSQTAGTVYSKSFTLYADMALQPSGPIRCMTDTPGMMRVSLVMTTRRMVPIVW